MNDKAKMVSVVAVVMAALIMFANFNIDMRRSHAKAQAEAARPTPVPTYEPYSTPEPAAPRLFKVSLVLADHAIGGRWLVECPDGCPAVSDVIHDETTGTWFNDVNRKFVWVKQGSGSLIIEEQ